MYPDLEGKTAIVTGASTGIGRGIAIRYGAEKVNVVVNYGSQKEEAEATAEEVRRAGGKAVVVQADVSQEAGIRILLDAAHTHFGSLDILVNNAGIQTTSPSHALTLDAWNRVMEVNLTGAFLGCREAIRYMLDNNIRGTIINVSSVHQQIPKPLHAHYAASKGGLKLLTQTLALEYAGRGIRVNGLAPGAIRTPMNEEILADQAQHEEVLGLIPMGEIGSPAQIAAAAAWLASAEASYVTGITLYADGGMTLR